MRPSLSAGPSGTTEAMKIPKSNLPVLSSPTITKPEMRTGAVSWRNITLTWLMKPAPSLLITSPKPSFGSFFRVTHTISLSGELRVGVSTVHVIQTGRKLALRKVSSSLAHSVNVKSNPGHTHSVWKRRRSPASAKTRWTSFWELSLEHYNRSTTRLAAGW